MAEKKRSEVEKGIDKFLYSLRAMHASSAKDLTGRTRVGIVRGIVRKV